MYCVDYYHHDKSLCLAVCSLLAQASNAMADLMEFIDDNKKAIFTESPVNGKLVIDGYELLHVLYDNDPDLDCWANGGRYAKQYQVTIKYFQKLKERGVEPVVVLDGGGSALHLNQVVRRRQKSIATLPEMIKKKQNNMKTKRFMPLMAREIFTSTMRDQGIEIYVADGKALKTIVYLANHYKCPILSDNKTYCHCNVEGGVIFYKHFQVDTCLASIYKQTKLISSCQLSNSDLVCAIVAVTGDGNSVPCRYNEVKEEIERIEGRSSVLKVITYFQKYASLEECRSCPLFRFKKFRENYQKVTNKYITNYYSSIQCLSPAELAVSTTMKCSLSCDIPCPILEAYRNGTFPVLAINAMTLGECVLEHCVGYQDLPPTSELGLSVRELIYGLVSDLMGSTCIKEYHRSKDGDLDYEKHAVTAICKHKELMVTKLFCKGDKSHHKLAVEAICEVLDCPESIVCALEHNKEDKSLILVTLVTHCWAEYLIKDEKLKLSKAQKLIIIQAFVINFFLDLSDPTSRPSEIDENNYYDDSFEDWRQVFHALLVWTSLYRNVHSLNAMLCEPLLPMSPRFLLDGPLVIFLAIHQFEGDQSLDKCPHKEILTPNVKSQCNKLLNLILSPKNFELVAM